jgi:hypothetical protein
MMLVSVKYGFIQIVDGLDVYTKRTAPTLFNILLFCIQIKIQKIFGGKDDSSKFAT